MVDNINEYWYAVCMFFFGLLNLTGLWAFGQLDGEVRPLLLVFVL